VRLVWWTRVIVRLCSAYVILFVNGQSRLGKQFASVLLSAREVIPPFVVRMDSIRIDPVRPFGLNFVTQYPTTVPKDEPNWTLWTVYGTEVLCQFGVRKAWEKPDAITHVQEILAPFDVSIPEYMTEHIHIVSYQYHHAQDRAQRETLKFIA